MSSNLRLLDLLQSLLGDYKELNDGEYSFFSPFKSHRKKKLQIQLDESSERFGWWHCWISDRSGKSLFSLFKAINASKKKFKRLAELLDEPVYNGEKSDKEYDAVILPDEYQPMWVKNRSPEWRHAWHYLKKRGVTIGDLVKYQIGYCERGDYKNRIIIPSFDAEDDINYFVGRAFFGDEWLKYKNPKAPKQQIIGFENLINWNYPLVLVEGVFDAIAVKRNAIPLFGKVMSNLLKHKILANAVDEVYVCLDDDAFNNALRISEDLMNNGVKVHLIVMDKGDPSDLGFERMTQLIKDSPVLSFENLIAYKLWK